MISNRVARISRGNVITLVIMVLLSMVAIVPARACAGPPANSDPDRDDREGSDYYNRGQYAKAADYYTRLLSQRGALSDLYFNRAMCYEGLKQWAKAVDDFTVVLKKQPRMYDAFVERGSAFFCEGRVTDAEKDIAVAMRLGPTEPGAYRVSGYFNFCLRKFEEAVVDYTQCIQFSRADDTTVDKEVYRNRAEANFALKRFDPAIADFKRLVATEPGRAGDAYARIGDCDYAKMDYPLALDAYTESIATNPTDGTSDVLKRRAEVYVRLKRYDLAKQDCQAYMATHPDDADFFVNIHKNLGLAEYHAELWSAAGTDLETYRAFRPDDVEITKVLPEIYVAKGDILTAIAQYHVYLAANPGDAVAWGKLGDAYCSARGYRSAIGPLSKSIALKPDPETLVHRGQTYVLMGGRDFCMKAEADASAALAMSPDYADALALKANALYGEQDYVVAAAAYAAYAALPGLPGTDRKYAMERQVHCNFLAQDYHGVVKLTTELLAANSDNPSLYDERGTAYVRLKQYVAGIADFVKFTVLEPADCDGWFALGVAYAGQKDNANSALAFERALALKPARRDAALNAGLAYQALAKASNVKREQCRDYCDRAVRLFQCAANLSAHEAKRDALLDEAATLEFESRVTGDDHYRAIADQTRLQSRNLEE